ncbi:unnamed protein product [Symbiodinium natans]|uniref:Uncharacterized protein n=1 Tax=Symbiodinium natans TaxID=878477 RepID=A0A812HYH0_9DINO|nr:unnamed protein product [Symbiodinium natans]
MEAGRYSEPVSVHQAFQELAPFGEIMRLELLPDEPDSVVVSYYDYRCALHAAAHLGSDRCSMEPQYGQCYVHLPNEATGCHIEEIGNTYAHCCDVRTAAKLALQFGVKEPKSKTRKAYVAPAIKADKAPTAPKYLNDLGISEVVWAHLDSGKETRSTLRITGVPAKLCKESRFHLLLEDADLAEHVDIFRTFTSTRRRLGTALVNAVSPLGVKLVAKFFHGRQWGNIMPAAVSFAATQGRDEVLRRYPFQENTLQKAKDTSGYTIAKVAVHVLASDMQSVSEVSTEVNDDAESLPSERH